MWRKLLVGRVALSVIEPVGEKYFVLFLDLNKGETAVTSAASHAELQWEMVSIDGVLEIRQRRCRVCGQRVARHLQAWSVLFAGVSPLMSDSCSTYAVSCQVIETVIKP